MRRIRQDAAAALVCYLTVSVALWSWGGFLTDHGAYRGLMAVVGGVVLVLGVVARALLPRWTAPVIQLLAGLGIVLGRLTAGSPARLHALVDAAHATFVSGYPPVQAQDIAIVLVPGAALAYAGADAVGVTARRPGLTGLVLLVVLAVPMGAAGTKGDGVPWAVFALAAIGFLGLLVVQEGSARARWGRALDDRSAAAHLAVHRGPALVGLSATVLALVVPLAWPAMHLRLNGWGAGDAGTITVSNPMVGMYGDLKQNADVDLVSVTPLGTTRPAPSYLKIAVLSQFDGAEWSTGSRRIPGDQTADGNLKPPTRTQRRLLDPQDSTTYQLSATTSFASSWLPVFDFPIAVRADGDWRYDTSTYDFIAATGNLTTAGATWTETASPVDPNAGSLERAQFGGSGAPAIDTALPDDLPGRIGSIAERVAGDQPTPFQQAVALQRWFTTPGRFRYSLERPGGDSSADLVSFLTTNKVGYCQQFATAMAVMARTLGIPARVDVGFLHSHPAGTNAYVFKGQDAHAWPELWFQGVGWVRFEPTPGVGAAVPSYTTDVGLATAPHGGGSTSDTQHADHPGSRVRPSVGPGPQSHTHQPTPSPAHHADTGASLTWAWALGGVVVAVLLAALPWAVRRRRRAVRLGGGAEAQWAELADTARDLRLPWDDGASPRIQGHRLAAHVTASGRDSLDRVVLAVERSRYARPGAASDDVREDAEAVIEELVGGVSRGEARSAALLPPTVVGGVRRRRARTGPVVSGPSDELH